MSTKISFVEWVAEREAAGVSKSDIASDISVTLASLYRYLANDRVPDRATMQRILDRSEQRIDVACFYAPKATQEGAAA